MLRNISSRSTTIESDMAKQTGAVGKTREAIFKRAYFECEFCGRENFSFGFSIHHRKPRGMGGTKKKEINDATNLILLCGSGTTGCHGWVESHRQQSYESGLLVKQSDDPSKIPFIDRYGNKWQLYEDFSKKIAYIPET